jgi:uncharacterized protein YabE (DUF348 family)
MDRHARFIIGVLAFTNIAAYISSRIILKQLNSVLHEYSKLYKTTVYMIDILEERGIDLTEFDLIALKSLREDNDA